MLKVVLSILISSVISAYTVANTSLHNVLGDSTHRSGEHQSSETQDNNSEHDGNGTSAGFFNRPKPTHSESEGNKNNHGDERESTESEKHFENRKLLVNSTRKLLGKGLFTCETKQKVIKNRSDSLVRFVKNMERVFDAIASKVETFYTNRLGAGGATVPNYDALVADIAAKKAVVDADLATAQSDAATFTCDGTDPKGFLELFRTDMQTVKKDLQDYRKSIKNLIVAVHPETKESSESTHSGEE